MHDRCDLNDVLAQFDWRVASGLQLLKRVMQYSHMPDASHFCLFLIAVIIQCFVCPLMTNTYCLQNLFGLWSILHKLLHLKPNLKRPMVCDAAESITGRRSNITCAVIRHTWLVDGCDGFADFAD